MFKNWKLLFKNFCENTCGWKNMWKYVKYYLKIENCCLEIFIKHPLSISHQVKPIPTIKSKGVNTVPEAVSVWPMVWYISDTGQYPVYRFRFIAILYIIYIYIHTKNKKIKKKKKKKRGKMVNDIVSTTRITTTKLTFRATLPLQILTTGIKERKKPNTYLILVFSSLVPNLFFSAGLKFFFFFF